MINYSYFLFKDRRNILHVSELQPFTFPRRIYFPTQNLLPNAEVTENIVERLVGGDGAARDFAQMLQA